MACQDDAVSGQDGGTCIVTREREWLAMRGVNGAERMLTAIVGCVQSWDSSRMDTNRMSRRGWMHALPREILFIAKHLFDSVY